MLLGSFLSRTYANPPDGEIFHVLELGRGTGSTRKYFLNFLAREEIPFTHNSTDISGSLVVAARKKFADHSFMDFMVLNIEESPPKNMMNQYHTIISTNCIHATRKPSKSMTKHSENGTSGWLCLSCRVHTEYLLVRPRLRPTGRLVAF